MHTESLLAGGGKMGALLREYDWANHPLGPPSTWPASLRTAVSIMLNSHFGMYIAWGEDFIQFYNDGYRPILGSTKHPAIGKSTTDTFHEAWDTIGPLFETVMSGKAVGSEDWCLPLERKGFLEECYFTFSYSPIMHEQGVGGVLVVVTETTARVLQQRRLASIRELALGVHSADSIDAVWQAARTALADNADDLPYVYCATTDNVDDITGNNKPTDVPATGLKLIKQALLDDSLVYRKGNTQLRTKPWSETVESLAAMPITRNSTKKHFGSLLVGLSPRLSFDLDYRDYLETIAREISTALNNVTAKLEEHQRAQASEELNRAKTTFFTNISHEFRTPLTLMLVPLEVLAASASAEQKPNIELALHNTRRLERLVNSLLNFSRLETGKVAASFKPTDLAVFTRDLASRFKSLLSSAGLSFDIDCRTLPQPVFVDRSMWEQVVLNLLSNAFKFTLAGGVSISLVANNKEAILTVQDSGVGIEAQNLTRIFERFYRIEDAHGRGVEGSGIGLSLVKELVELHGGHLECHSTFGEGTQFRISLPLGCQHLPANQVVRSDGKALPSKLALQITEEAQRWLPEPDNNAIRHPNAPHKKNILVVEDNADMRLALKNILAPHFNLYLQSNGEAALALLQHQAIHLVLCDAMMPVMSGFELLTAIRASTTLSSIPFILISARSDDDTRSKYTSSPADDYVNKPFRAKELLSRVNQQLALADIRRTMQGQAQLIDEQAKLLAATEKLRERKALLSAIFDFAPVGVTLADRHGDYVKINRAFEKISGYSEAYALEHNLESLSLPEDWVEHKRLRKKLLEKKIDEFTLVKRLQRFDGSLTWTRHTVGPVIAADGRVSHTVALVEDISEEMAAKKQIKLLSDRSVFLSDLGFHALSTKKLEDTFSFCIQNMTKNLAARGIGLFIRQKDSDNYALCSGSGLLNDTRLPIVLTAHDLDVITGGSENIGEIQTFVKTKSDSNNRYSTFFAKFNSLSREIQVQELLGATLFSSNKLYGVMLAIGDEQSDFDQEDSRFLHACANMLSAIVERNQFIKNLAANRELFSQAQELAGLAHWELNVKTGKVKWSDNLSAIVGLPDTAEYKTLQAGLEKMHPDDKDRVQNILHDVGQKGGKQDFVCRLIGLDNNERVLQMYCVGVLDEDNKVDHILGSTLDITERKQHEQQLEDYADSLKALSHQLVQAQEDERKRLAIELHDQVGQNMTALGLSVSMLKQLVAKPSAAFSQKLQDTHAILDATNLSIEHILNDIRPPLLEDWGLSSALEWYVSSFNKHYGIEALVYQTGDVRRIDLDAETALYRATQEALNNVAKHSAAKQVEISLVWCDAYLLVDIVDNGQGAMFAQQSQNTGFGLTTMRERIEGVGGDFLVESVKDKGTRVHFRVEYES